jgi:Skp family chaperone for outer membrane proteins
MHFRLVFVGTLAAAVALPGVLAAAEEERAFGYAYVNMERVIDEYILFKEAKKEAEGKIDEARVEDLEKMSEYQEKLVALEEKAEGPLTPEAKAQAKEEYSAIYREALDFRDTLLTKYKRIERDAFEPVYKNVYEKIASYAKKEDYEVVFDYSAIMLYADEKYDITEDIVNELNEEAGISK